MDWDALRDAALVLPPPSPLPPPQALPRAHLLAQHAQLAEQERRLDREGQVRTRKVVVGPGKHFSAAPSAASLRPCQLSDPDLVLDKPARERILVVRNLVAPVRTAAVQLVVEDCTGRAVPLSIYHVPARYDQRELKELWPVGALYGIKEPLLRSLRSGFHVRVDSPADVVRLFPSSPLVQHLPSPFPRSPAHALDGKGVSALKDAGNVAFKAGRWIRAREAYEWSLAALERGGGTGASAEDELGATVRSNLALVYLELDFPAAARHVAERALHLVPPPIGVDEPPSPLRAKLVYRLALAHYALEAYPPCLDALAPLLALIPPDPLAAALAERAHARTVEAAQGPSPATLRALFRAASSTTTGGASSSVVAPPDVADYASPLIGVRPSPTDPSRGRALVALAPIPRGMLVACLKPVVLGGGPAAARAGRTAYCAGGVAADASRAEGAVTFNAFSVEDLASSLPGARPSASTANPDLDHRPDDPDDAEGFHSLTALYPPLASALNHSCLPTASYTFLGTLFLLRTRVDLAEGDELTDSYADATDPLDVRASKLAPHGFVCACALCGEERGAGERTRREREGLVRRLDEEEERGREGRAELERVRGIKRALEGTYKRGGGGKEGGDERARVRPPLYSAARLLAQRLVDSPGGATPAQLREAVETEVEALRALGAEFEPGEGGGGGTGKKKAEEGARWEAARMARPPLVGDTNAVLSALFIARVWRDLGRDEGTRHWIALAREIEAGQAGVELFELRYGPFARRYGLDLEQEANLTVLSD
ncbi:uncharacterized protein RHOBADRAFT_55290 [Rhodotorula graminis WP1]|uniref:SET domain-containing protein n=1 Tax=Rhodotorula graminis (strain WP1) TaxID=578459 RepID=A0A0P9FBR4_RHOGW|nr:uncharacterized protein RHOBADRAFT_55290 [Rhodotorula graminis WP1]KPV73054.1 hypothetical protein RHOBADRAFT_55290 [Rhodotorula graminis WP1]